MTKRKEGAGWKAVPPRARRGDVHVIPIKDLRKHDETRSCWCEPRITREPGCYAVVSHNSMDGRELGVH